MLSENEIHKIICDEIRINGSEDCTTAEFNDDVRGAAVIIYARIATFTALLREAGELLKPISDVAKDLDTNVFSKEWSDKNQINLCGDGITAGLVRRAADIQKRIQEVVNG